MINVPEQRSPVFSPWRHGGWYVSNVRYPNGGCGCVSRNYLDKQWRIVCDPRRDMLGCAGDYTFPTREAAALAERELIKQLALRDALIQAIKASGHSVSGPTDVRVAEHGEPAWVCNARTAIAEVMA